MAKLQPMIAASKPDELMIITAVYDHDARKKSYSLLADAFGLGNSGGVSQRPGRRGVLAVIPGRCEASNPESNASGFRVQRYAAPERRSKSRLSR